jgi:hypothetical protein
MTFGLRADDQLRIFENVPMDDSDHFLTLTLTPSDNLLVCTPQGDRRVNALKMPLRLRWKHESLRLTDATMARYMPAAMDDLFSEHNLVEFETKQAKTNNLRLSLLFDSNDADVVMGGLVSLLPGEPSIAPDPASDVAGSKS